MNCDGIVEREDYQKALEKGQIFLKEKSIKFCLINLQKMKMTHNSFDNWTKPQWVSNAIQNGIEKFIIVVSPSIFGKKAYERIKNTKKTASEIVNYFTSLEDAQSYLNNLK